MAVLLLGGVVMITWLEWIGSALQIFGAMALATRFWPARTAYAVMLLGAVLWVFIATVTHNWPLLWMQLTFSVINLVGIVSGEYDI